MRRRRGRLAWIVALVLVATSTAQAQTGQVPPAPDRTPPPRPAGPPAVMPRVLTPPVQPTAESIIEDTVKRFTAAYARKGSPRIVLYWNRELDEVAPPRHQAAGAPSARRETTPMEWELQNAFVTPLIQAGVRLVDRAAIQRLRASQPDRKPASEDGRDLQVVEIEALRGYADLWVEIAGATSAATSGVPMRAVLKNVATGIIVAHVTAPGGPAAIAPGRAYVGTSRGFELREPSPPSPRQSATQLSVNLMEALIDHWRR